MLNKFKEEKSLNIIYFIVLIILKRDILIYLYILFLIYI